MAKGQATHPTYAFMVVVVVGLGTEVELELGRKLEKPGGGLLMGGTRPGGGGGGGGVPFKSTTVLKPGGGGILGGQGPPRAGKSSCGMGQGRGPRGLGSPGGSFGVLRARADPSECPLTTTVTGTSALLKGASGTCSAPEGFGV